MHCLHHDAEREGEVGGPEYAYDAQRHGDATDIRPRTHPPRRIGVVDGCVQVFSPDDLLREQP